MRRPNALVQGVERGFTLIELMIAVAVVGILAAIAVPSYTAYIQRSRITEAVSALSTTSVNMERFFQDNRTYVGACAVNTVAPLPVNTAQFTFACPTLTASQFTATATGTGGMNGFTYSINQQGTRATVALPAGWASIPSPSTCWILKADGSC